MRNLFAKCCCCCGSYCSCCDCAGNAEVSSETSWTPGDINKTYVKNPEQDSESYKRTDLPTIIITQPSMSQHMNRMNEDMEYIDDDFSNCSTLEARDRYGDMAQTIFVRNTT